MSIDPRRLLDSVLEGERLTGRQLHQLIELKEGQHLEFKDGLATKKKKDIRELREAVNAFGNSSGGLLVVGVIDNDWPHNPRRIRPCTPPGREPLDKWAENLIVGKEHFSPPPRIEVVDDGEGPVLILAVPRARRIVPIPRSGEMAYFLRLNQSTLQAPPYLLSDLMLGRRRHPSIRIKSVRVGCQVPPGNKTTGDFQFYLEVENDGLIHVEQLMAGVVCWARYENPGDELNRHLRTYLQIPSSQGDQPGQDYVPKHLPGQYGSTTEPAPLKPFACLQFKASGCWLPLSSVRFTAAAYVLPLGSEPLWYEIEFNPPAKDGLSIQNKVESQLEGPIQGRPRVSWELQG